MLALPNRTASLDNLSQFRRAERIYAGGSRKTTRIGCLGGLFGRVSMPAHLPGKAIRVNVLAGSSAARHRLWNASTCTEICGKFERESSTSWQQLDEGHAQS
jgi:hypothetical protein